MFRMKLIWFLALGVQLRLGAGYPEGRPDCPVVGQWIDHAGNRSVTVSTVQPGILDYLKLQPTASYLLTYQNNWDTHKGEVKTHHGNFLVAGVVPSVQQHPEHLLYLVLACYRKELWVLAVPYLSGEYHGSAFFKMTPVMARASDDVAPPPSPNDTDHRILVNVSMWGGPRAPSNDTEAPLR